MNFAPPQWGAALFFSDLPRFSRSHVFISTRLSTDYPQIIHGLSAHYPHIIRTLSTCYLSCMRRSLERIRRCRHAPTGSERFSALQLLSWDGQGDGCHSKGQRLAWQQWPGTLHAIRREQRRGDGCAQRKRAQRRARADGGQRQVGGGLVQAGLREGCERAFR